MKNQDDQSSFWSGAFGDEYILRNTSKDESVAKMIMFSRMLRNANKVGSAVELGCNIGLNLEALKSLNADVLLSGYEINKSAILEARDLSIGSIHEANITRPIKIEAKFEMSFTVGVLIHVAPEQLTQVYDNLYNLSSRYILICEYYSPTPVMVEYRGNKDKLFKRDFAGEMIDLYDLTLIDYGFFYNRDNQFTYGDFNWFLLERK